MGETNLDEISCKHCGYVRDDQDSGPCPNCGKTGRLIKVSISESIGFSGSLSWKHTKEYYEKNRGAQIIVILIAIISPFIGLVFAGFIGVVIGLLFSLLSYSFGANAIIKVREIARGGDL
jgi:hypothetical protein